MSLAHQALAVSLVNPANLVNKVKPDPLALLDQPDLQDLKEIGDHLVNQDHPEMLAKMAILELRATMACQVNEEVQAQLGYRAALVDQVLKEKEDFLVSLANKVNLDLADLSVNLDLLDLMEEMEMMAHQDHLAHQDLADLQDTPVKLEATAIVDKMVHLVLKEDPVKKGQEERQVYLAQQDSLVPQDHKEQTDPLDHKEIAVKGVSAEMQDPRVLTDLLDLRAFKVLLEKPANAERMVLTVTRAGQADLEYKGCPDLREASVTQGCQDCQDLQDNTVQPDQEESPEGMGSQEILAVQVQMELEGLQVMTDHRDPMALQVPQDLPDLPATAQATSQAHLSAKVAKETILTCSMTSL